MSDNTALVTTLIIFILAMWSGIMYSEGLELKKVEAGLQECVDTSAGTPHIVWQKECK